MCSLACQFVTSAIGLGNHKPQDEAGIKNVVLVTMYRMDRHEECYKTI